MAKKKTVKKTINIKGKEIEIALITNGNEEYISLTDMAKGFGGEAGDYIRNWLRNGSTVNFLGEWEQLHNEDFNLVEFRQIKSIDNAFLMSAKKWIERTNAIGIQIRVGRYGGTYAHKDIAMQFASWLSPEFHVHILKELQKLGRNLEGADLEEVMLGRYKLKIQFKEQEVNSLAQIANFLFSFEKTYSMLYDIRTYELLVSNVLESIEVNKSNFILSSFNFRSSIDDYFKTTLK